MTLARASRLTCSLGLLGLTAALIGALETARLPAAFLIGSIGAGIILAAFDGTVALPRQAFALAQGIVACLVARNFPPAILTTFAANWPVFVVGVLSVLAASTAIGWIMARRQVLPATTAIWGSAPGAATAMVLMSETYGADMRLVAFMQYLRVVIVALVASSVARLWASTGPAPTTNWFPHLRWGALAATLAIVALAGRLASRLRLPAPFFIGPMLLGLLVTDTHLVDLELPPWLLAASYVIVGWAIGLRFTRPILARAAGALPAVAGSILALVAACAALAALLHLVWRIDPLTAYLATSPGGADTVAIIAASSHVDIRFVLAMQTARFLVLLVFGPALTRRLADRFQARQGAPTPAE